MAASSLSGPLTARAQQAPKLPIIGFLGVNTPAARSQLTTAFVQRLGDLGNTVLVIEHNLDVIKSADWIIDLGPDGGEDGGRVVACGTPEQVVRSRKSYTGEALRKVLPAGKAA